MNNQRYSAYDSRFLLPSGQKVYVPSVAQRNYGKNLVEDYFSLFPLPIFYYHLQKGGHIAALESHLNDQYFACLDISKFFNSITTNRITRVLKTSIPWQKARDIAKYSTVPLKTTIKFTFLANPPAVSHSPLTPKKQLNQLKTTKLIHVLPFGYCQSPWLASLVLNDSRLGSYLNKIDKNSIKVSVYMDDIILSGNNKTELDEAYNQAIRDAEQSKFHINLEKSQPPSSKITVFNIHLSTGYLELTHERMLLFINEYRQTTNPHKKNAIARYVNSVNPRQTRLL